MVHKHKSFPVGKAGQRKFKQQLENIDKNNDSESKSPKPDAAGVLGTKALHISFLSILGTTAHEKYAQKGGRKTWIDPLSLKKIADNLLKEIESKTALNHNDTSDYESSDISDEYP